MAKVLIADQLSPRAVEIFQQKGVEVDVKTGLPPAELAAIIGEYDGLALRSSTKVTRDILSAATKLRVVGRAGIGIDNIDLAAATEKGVVVMNTPFGNSITTAEHALSLMLALARDIPQANASTRAGKWEKNRFMGVELYGKILGVIGCGNIGAIVADRAVGLKMKVVAFDPFLTEDRARDLGIEKVSLDDLLARADFITLHTPLTEQTKNILDAKALAKTRKGVRIINCARGGLIDEAALHEAIVAGHVAGAALDVFLTEPAKESPLFALEQVICTPHLGASTTEAQENVALQVAEQMADYLVHGAVVNALNMPSLSAEDAPKLKPYLKLAEQLGSFMGQAADQSFRTVSIAYQGHVTGLNLRPLSAVILKGLLSPIMAGVNMVNAPVIARQRDIVIKETRLEQAGDLNTLITVTLEGDNGSRSVAGTLLSDKPRVVAIDGVPTEAELTGTMILTQNRDKPGFIGSLGTVLGENGVNIASFFNGRSAPGADALCLVSVDGNINELVLEKLSALPQVVRVKVLNFAREV
ncbi:MAG: phosphoglycerate dehydrogenase [Alphaproteobacteria bacterium]